MKSHQNQWILGAVAGGMNIANLMNIKPKKQFQVT
jgi:hypothetical protein